MTQVGGVTIEPEQMEVVMSKKLPLAAAVVGTFGAQAAVKS